MYQFKRQYLPSRVVCSRYNICTRTLYRWREAPKLGFPKGIEINGRRYYGSDELDEWDRERALVHADGSYGRDAHEGRRDPLHTNQNRTDPEFRSKR